MPEFSVSQQVLVFFIVFFIGSFSGVIFDFFKAIKNVLCLSAKSLFLIDFIISLAITLLVFQLLLRYHWGEVRVYVFISFFSGIILYYLFMGRYCYRVFYRFFRRCLKIAIKIIFFVKDLQNKSRIKIKRIVKYWRSFFRKEK
jgi:hypothetical protein